MSSGSENPSAGSTAGTPADTGKDTSAPPREATPSTGNAPSTSRRRNMLPGRERRRFRVERLLMRLVATAGIVGIGVALGAILAASKVQGWITGLVVALVSVVLAGVLWSSRQL